MKEPTAGNWPGLQMGHPRPTLVHRALRWAGDTKARCGRLTRRNTACLRPDLLSALLSCLRRLPPVCRQTHRQITPLRPTSPARPTASTMRPMWFGEEPTVERSCAVDPIGPSSAIAHPITAVQWSADHITAIAHPITAVRWSADRITDIALPITDGRSSAAGLTGRSSAGVPGKRRRPLLGRGRGSGQDSDHCAGGVTKPHYSREPFSRQGVEWTSRPPAVCPHLAG